MAEVEDLIRQIRERDELISFLNDERLRQSRIIATQTELIGRRNRSIDQLHHMRRVSLVSNPKPSHAVSFRDRVLLGNVAKAVERLNCGRSSLSENVNILPLVNMALSYVSGDAVQVSRRRHSSVPSQRERRRRDQETSPLPSPVLSCHTEGEEPSGGFELELVYYSPPVKQQADSKVNELAGSRAPLMADLSPRSISGGPDAIVSLLVGRYETPLGTTEIRQGEYGKLSGVWGVQTAYFTCDFDTEISASLEISGFKIFGRRDPFTGALHWNGGQIWTRLQHEEEPSSLAGHWSWGGEPAIELVSSSEGVLCATGVWGVQKIRLEMETITNSVVCEMAGGIRLHGHLREEDGVIRWGNGQVWRRNSKAALE